MGLGVPYILPFLRFNSGGRLFGSIVINSWLLPSIIVYSLSMITKARGKVSSTVYEGDSSFLHIIVSNQKFSIV